MNNQVKITFENETSEFYPEGISLLELSKYYQENMTNPIIAAKINNIVYPLSERIKSNAKIKFIDVNDINGQTMYLAALKFISLVATKDIFGDDANLSFLNSLDRGLYTMITINEPLTKDLLDKIKKEMQDIINMDFAFERVDYSKKDAVNYLMRNHDEAKAKNIQNLSNSVVTFYKLKQYFNYFYADLPSSTRVCNRFDLTFVDDKHFVIGYPTARSNNVVPKYQHFNKTLEVFEQYRKWLEMIGASYVCNVNDIVSKNKIREFIQMTKLMLDCQFPKIADDIYKSNGKIKIVCMAGPSSSGKTTSAHRVALSLKAIGYNPIIISADNYYKERDECPKDKNGEYDFECLEALDLKLFNDHLKKLLDGETVLSPKFNFYNGKKEWTGTTIKLEKNDILIIEGLHCLNDEFTKVVPRDLKYKIYVSPFMGLRIDHHNHISTVDLRLLRRIVRDAVFRGSSVSDTIKGWQKVRAGEEKYIYPFQNDVDMILNTASSYEIGVLKVYAEPLLYSVPVNSPYYEEARRLLGTLRIYFPISSEYVASDSVLREFIGGSVFNPNK